MDTVHRCSRCSSPEQSNIESLPSSGQGDVAEMQARRLSPISTLHNTAALQDQSMKGEVGYSPL